MLVRSANHAALQGICGIGRIHAVASLTAAHSVPAVLIQRPAGLRLIVTAVGIVRIAEVCVFARRQKRTLMRSQILNCVGRLV